jgi:hypothetical protein
MPSPNPFVNPPAQKIPDPQSGPPKETLVAQLLKCWLTNARVWGYARHAGSWIATYLATHHLLGGDSSSLDLVAGCVANAAVILWSWHADAKDTLRQKVAGLSRHLLTIGLGVAVFKGYISSDDANTIIETSVGLIVSFGVSAAAGEKLIPKAPLDGQP